MMKNESPYGLEAKVALDPPSDGMFSAKGASAVRVEPDCNSSLTDSATTIAALCERIAGLERELLEQQQRERSLRQVAEEFAQSRNDLERRVNERTASLREAIAQMEEVSYTISHDLRAPLRAMRMYSNVLLEELEPKLVSNSPALHCLHRIADNAARMDQMILDVLTFGRVARDGLTLEPVSLDKLVRGIVQIYPEMQPPLAEIEISPLLDAVGHAPSISQAVSNLLANAVKFVPIGVKPMVRVWTECRGDDVRLWIKDNGIGIDPAYHHRLYAMFERIHPDLPYDGSGVGLAIVRKAAERMQGKTGMESDGKNGSAFWLQLPGTGRKK